MPKCIPCFGTEIKQALAEAFDSPALNLLLGQLPDCDQPQDIQVCAGGRGRGKRAPSAYNTFVGQCVKGRASGTPVSEAMKGCAARWKQQKGK